MKKSLYLETKALRNIMFPNNNMLEASQLSHSDCIEDYINSLFSTHLHYFDSSKFTDADDIQDMYAPVVVKLIITTADRTGLWLVHEQDKQKISIPGGHVSREDVEFVRKELGNTSDGLLVLQEALSREMYEETYGEDVGYDMYDTNKELLTVTPERGTLPLVGVMSAVHSKFKTSYKISPIDDLFYLYKGKDRQCSRSITFYYVAECDRLSPVKAYPKNFIWLDKEEFRLSCRKEYIPDMFPILGDPIVPVKKDIRFAPEYRPILEIIFNTSELF